MNQPIKWHGGKHYLAKKIIELMPPRDGERPWHLYREPFAGGLSVLLQLDPEGLSEAVTDKHEELTNFWHVLGDEQLFEAFQRLIECQPFSEKAWQDACNEMGFYSTSLKLQRAAAFFVCARQSRQGLMKDFATPTRRLRRGMNENVSAWLSAVDGLPDVHARLRRVEIRCMDAIAFIEKYDDPQAVFYVDPPYMHETRTVCDAYAHEMGFSEHEALLLNLEAIQGRFLLSGYRSELYDHFAAKNHWRRVDIDIDNKSGSGETKQRRTECVWMNY